MKKCMRSVMSHHEKCITYLRAWNMVINTVAWASGGRLEHWMSLFWEKLGLRWCMPLMELCGLRRIATPSKPSHFTSGSRIWSVMGQEQMKMEGRIVVRSKWANVGYPWKPLHVGLGVPDSASGSEISTSRGGQRRFLRGQFWLAWMYSLMCTCFWNDPRFKFTSL